MCAVPRSTFLCTAVLRDESVFDSFRIFGASGQAAGFPCACVTVAARPADLPVDLIPYDDDVLSMELPMSLRVR